MVHAVKLLPDRRVRQLSGHSADQGNRLKTPKKEFPPLSGHSHHGSTPAEGASPRLEWSRDGNAIGSLRSPKGYFTFSTKLMASHWLEQPWPTPIVQCG